MPSITVDPRAGSKDLVPFLRALGVPVEIERMTYGDLWFLGNGPDGPTPVGIEHKSVSDVLQCITSGRFTAHQLPGLLDSFPFPWLVVEGAFSAGPQGELLVAHRGKLRPVPWGRTEWLYRHLAHWLLSIQIQGGCRVVVTRDKRDSAAFIKSLFTWWTAKQWREHDTLKAIHHQNGSRIGSLASSTITYKRKQKVANALHAGLGWERSGVAASHFKSVEEMILAPMSEWAGLEGIGEITARKVRNAIVGRG